MRITRETSLFFDASALVAGAHSLEGGSALLLKACKVGGFRAQTTFLILFEALRALGRLSQASLGRFHQLVIEISWELLEVPPKEAIEEYRSLIDPKDVHVLASAVESGADFLLTLDRRHILAASEAVRKADLPIIILRPGDFIRQYYPQHEAYPNLPTTRAHPGTRERGS